MKRTKQTHTGNVTGTGKKWRGKNVPVAETPRNVPTQRSKERFILPCGMSPLLVALFKRGGLSAPY